PLRVMCVRVSGRFALPYHCAASTCLPQSMASTTNLTPVGTPIRASGHRAHHAVIRSGSVVASLKPCGVSGDLLSPHGKIAPPRRVSANAWCTGVLLLAMMHLVIARCIVIALHLVKALVAFATDGD